MFTPTVWGNLCRKYNVYTTKKSEFNLLSFFFQQRVFVTVWHVMSFRSIADQDRNKSVDMSFSGSFSSVVEVVWTMVGWIGLLVAVIGMLSLFQVSNGVTNSFALLAMFRFLHGAVSSAINPLCYSLLADIFPPDQRSTPNSLLSAANFVGIALSSMTIILIKSIGWRNSYLVMGATGLVASLSSYFFLKNPKRGQYEIPLSPEEKEKKQAKDDAKPKGF